MFWKYLSTFRETVTAGRKSGVPVRYEGTTNNTSTTYKYHMLSANLYFSSVWGWLNGGKVAAAVPCICSVNAWTCMRTSHLSICKLAIKVIKFHLPSSSSPYWGRNFNWHLLGQEPEAFLKLFCQNGPETTASLGVFEQAQAWKCLKPAGDVIIVRLYNNLSNVIYCA